MPTALIVSSYFPPLSSAGSSIRLIKLMKYAAQEEWSFSVLTQDPKRPVNPEKRLSAFLLKEIPERTDIIRVGNPFWGRSSIAWLGRKIAKDSSLPWGCSTAFMGWKSYRRKKPDLIYANTPPFTNALIGAVLTLMFRAPLILDIKDDWVGSTAYWKKGFLKRSVEAKIEQSIVRLSAATILVTQSSLEAYLNRYAPLGFAEKFFLIPNGVDLDEYHPLWGRERKPEGNNFHILTASSGHRPNYRDLTPFLQSLEIFLNRCPKAQKNIIIEFVGEEELDSGYKTWLNRLLPPSSMLFSGVLDRLSFPERLWKADLFFLVQPRKNFTAIPGTLYEYWATGKAPIILFSEAGASSYFISNYHLGEHYHFNQVEAASLYIERVYNAFINRKPIWIERKGVELYDRRKMVHNMLDIWLTVIKNFRGS
jgi:glycosyltransferase involved in cell wall biosynthesis